MKARGVQLFFGLLLATSFACNLFSRVENQPFIFPTPIAFFPTITPSATPPVTTATPTPIPSPTPRVWPSPHFGSPGPTPVTPVPTPLPVFFSEENVNILLIGSDKKSGASYRTDAMIVVSYLPRHNAVTLISIPRDLYVYIPGWTMQRINAAFLHGELGGYPGGGAGLLMDTILYNLGISIDHYILVDFNGFRQIIDALGGIEVPLACPYTDWHIIDPNASPQDEDNWKLYTVGPGIVSMDGDLALWYARSRLRSSDFDRGRRQQEILRAAFDKALRLNVIPRIPDLYTQTRQSLTTDLTLESILSLAPLAIKLDSARIRSFYINRDAVNAWRTPQGAAVQLPEAEALFVMLQAALGPPNEAEQQHLSTVVEIWNGTTNQNWETLAAERLHYGGFETQVGLAEQRNYSKTLLYDFGTAQNPNQSQALLLLLGLNSSALVSQPDSYSPVDYRLVLGTDYQPCFDPAKISR